MRDEWWRIVGQEAVEAWRDAREREQGRWLHHYIISANNAPPGDDASMLTIDDVRKARRMLDRDIDVCEMGHPL